LSLDDRGHLFQRLVENFLFSHSSTTITAVEVQRDRTNGALFRVCSFEDVERTNFAQLDVAATPQFCVSAAPLEAAPNSRNLPDLARDQCHPCAPD